MGWGRQSGRGDFGDWRSWAPRPTVAERKKSAAREIAKLRKEGKAVSPVVLEGSAIARTFWGKAWCGNLERYSDFENRLPRGRSYVRSGSVIDLQITPGKVTALVRGTELYTITIHVTPVEPRQYRAIVQECAGKIGSVIELLQGRLSGAVMEVITREKTGLFPSPKELRMKCSCPDWATMCKHVAAALYGIGARLDREPELLFRLRSTDPAELVATAATGALAGKRPSAGERALGGDLESVFGIDLDLGPAAKPAKPAKPANTAKKAGRRSAVPPPPPVTISGAALSALGVPPATVQYWLKTGVLVRTEARGIYERTARAEERLERYRAGASGWRATGAGS
jgi:uncharacterized Zn finger protein